MPSPLPPRPRRVAHPGALVAALLLALAGPLAPPAAGQGWIEPPPDRPALAGWNVERVASRVTITVEGRVARVEVRERFRNRGSGVAEGSYLYPLPGEAAFASFSLYQGETELRGEVMDRERARAIYEEIVRRRADPALIELAGHGLLRARVFPIEPGQEREVTLHYQQLLSRAGDALHVQYAGGVAEQGRSFDPPTGPEPLPRPGWRPPPVREHREDPTDRRPADAAPELELVVEDAGRFLAPFSPTHALETDRERTGDRERLVVRPRDAVEGHLSVFLPLARAGVGVTVAAHAPGGDEAGYVMVTLSPGEADGPAQPRDLAVVVDVSGSMSGQKIEQARTALLGLLETLGPDDRFRLVAFSNRVRTESDGWRRADHEALREAAAWVRRLAADGGTNIEGALDEAFRTRPGEGRLPLVVFLTDGLPTVGEQNPERIAARAEAIRGEARVFAFGVGDDVNTHLLDRLSAATRGSTEYVRPGESVEHALSLLSARIRHPVLTDLAWDGVPVRLEAVYPVDIPDVFAGEELVLFGRYDGAGEGSLGLRGRRAGRTERFRVDAVFPERSDANAFIPRLWASRKLGHLTRQLWIEGHSPALVEEIRATALRYGLPSEFTAYLVQEPVMVADGARGTMQRQSAPMARNVAASGAGAVRAAEEARRLRSVSDAADLDRVEAEMEGDVGGGARRVAGRLFHLADGVWTEAGIPDDLPVVSVRRFSRAWFDLLAELPEVARVGRELERVVVRGGAVAVRLDDEGASELTPERLARLVRDFRTGTP